MIYGGSCTTMANTATEGWYTILLDPDEEEGGYTVTVPA
jgi:hypothetical protein